MSDVTVERLEEFENNHGFYCRARAGLGVSAFGFGVVHWPPGNEDYPSTNGTTAKPRAALPGTE